MDAGFLLKCLLLIKILPVNRICIITAGSCGYDMKKVCKMPVLLAFPVSGGFRELQS